jgi:hypothetical protein
MNFFIKQLLKNKLKGLPDDQIDMFIELIEKNPEFFQQIASEIKAKSDAGMGQEAAAMEVIKKHEAKFKEILGK